MDHVDVIAVVGACGPERRRIAARMSEMSEAALLPASRLVGSPDPVQEAAILASWTTGAVVEFPDEVVATELIGAFAEADPRLRLRALVCVVDASHVLEDLYREDYIPLRDDESGIHAPLVARAELTMRQIEYASVIVLTNWVSLDTSTLATLMALLSSLSPRARLRLHRKGFTPVQLTESYAEVQDRAGWVCLLNGDHAPHMRDRCISTLRYEEPRPFHPGRLRLLLDRIDAGEFGRVMRSAGFCRLATRPDVVAQWEHVGRMITFSPLAVDAGTQHGEELLAVGQDLAFIGLDLDTEQLANALAEASLTDHELVAGPVAWLRLADPFPAWTTTSERRD